MAPWGANCWSARPSPPCLDPCALSHVPAPWSHAYCAPQRPQIAPPPPARIGSSNCAPWPLALADRAHVGVPGPPVEFAAWGWISDIAGRSGGITRARRPLAAAPSRKFRSRSTPLVLCSAIFRAGFRSLVRPSSGFLSFYPVFEPGFRGLPCPLALPTRGCHRRPAKGPASHSFC